MYARLAFVPLFVVACSSASPSASVAEQASVAADGWCHKRLVATGGALVSLENRLEQGTLHGDSFTNATSVYLVAKSDHFRPSDRARVALTVRSYSGRCGTWCRDHQSSFEQSFTVDMAYESGRFVAQMPQLSVRLFQSGSDDWSEYFYDIAVVVNGVWYKNGETDLRYDPLDTGTSLCAHDPAL